MFPNVRVTFATDSSGSELDTLEQIKEEKELAKKKRKKKTDHMAHKPIESGEAKRRRDNERYNERIKQIMESTSSVNRLIMPKSGEDERKEILDKLVTRMNDIMKKVEKTPSRKDPKEYAQILSILRIMQANTRIF